VSTPQRVIRSAGTTASASRAGTDIVDEPESPEEHAGEGSKDNPLKKAIRLLDRAQQKHRAPGFVFGVVKKFGDDNGGSLAALLTYYGFLSVFPLLLVTVTVLGIVAGSHPALEHTILKSALSEFPVIGNQLGDNIKALHRDSPVGLTVGLLGLIWGATGICQNAQYAMSQVWNIPKISRPGFLPRLARSALLLLVGAVFIVASSYLSGLATFSGTQGAALRVVGAVLSAVVDVVLFVFVYRILTPASVAWRTLVPGSVVAGILWAALQIGGVFLMDHELKNMSQVYGFFAIVLGVLWWIYLAAQLVVYCAEINVVRARRLWPRSIVQPPLTHADMQALDFYALAEQRRPEVRVSTVPADDAAGAAGAAGADDAGGVGGSSGAGGEALNDGPSGAGAGHRAGDGDAGGPG
jgi:YihY family inner membrane protein